MAVECQNDIVGRNRVSGSKEAQHGLKGFTLIGREGLLRLPLLDIKLHANLRGKPMVGISYVVGFPRKFVLNWMKLYHVGIFAVYYSAFVDVNALCCFCNRHNELSRYCFFYSHASQTASSALYMFAAFTMAACEIACATSTPTGETCGGETGETTASPKDSRFSTRLSSSFTRVCVAPYSPASTVDLSTCDA